MAAINQVAITNFLVFRNEFLANFGDGVNIFIGNNGTGKTTLMKVLYWGCEFSNKSSLEDSASLITSAQKDTPFNPIFSLYGYFNQTVSKEKNAEIISKIKIYNNSISSKHPVLNVSVSKGLGSITMRDMGIDTPQRQAFTDWCKLKIQSVYIPVTEMLSHSRGFLALHRERPVPFDYTEVDIISKAELEPTREITKNAKKTIDIIAKVIGGKVVFDGKEFFVEHKKGNKIPFSFEASGFRKLGLLWKLLRNGLLEKDAVLFWDEPENSLNPELVPVLVKILLELAQNGVQIFLATHDYNLARHFDVRKNKDIPVLYHNLSKVDNRQIVFKSSPEYTKLYDNSIERANEDLFEAVVSDAMEAEDDE
jgi:AAA15 family ATPase/GTPase